MTFQRILIAADDDPVAVHASEIGAELARSLGAEVALIYVLDTSAGYAAETGIAPQELAAQGDRDGKKLLAGFRERLQLPTSAPEFVQTGVPATEIVKAAKDWPADLIVIGSHGRSGLERAIVGSIAEAVMRHAPCPVLVVRAQEGAG